MTWDTKRGPRVGWKVSLPRRESRALEVAIEEDDDRVGLAGELHVRTSENNTLVVGKWRDEEGKLRQRKSSTGMLGYKGAKRGTGEASQSTVRKVGRERRGQKITKVHVYLNGYGPGRGLVTAVLTRLGIQVLTRTDSSREPHGGCRGKKRRRV